MGRRHCPVTPVSRWISTPPSTPLSKTVLWARREGRRGLTLVEICVVVGLAALLSVVIFRVGRDTMGWSGRDLGRSNAQAAFTQLSEVLGRDLGGALPALPRIEAESIVIVPSQGATVTYRLLPGNGLITRSEETGRAQDFRFVGKPGEASRFEARLHRESGPEAYALALRLTPNASFPAEVFERSFPFRFTGFSGAFFQGDRPLPRY